MSDIEFQGWTPDPSDARGTASLIWSCMATIFLTTWAAHHPMVSQTGFKHRLARFIRSIMLPEYQAFHAIDFLTGALKLRNIIRTRPGWKDWTLCQAFHVVIGGWKLEETKYQRRRPRKLMAWMAFAAGMFQTSPWTFVDLVVVSKILRSDAPSPDDTRNRTGFGRLAKALTVFQVLWFLANITWRLATKRHISLLKVLTAAYVVCGLSVYVALFCCPQVVREPSIVAASGTLGTTSSPGTLPSTFELGGRLSYLLWALMGSVCVGVYLAAWTYPFNSDVAWWLWRGSVRPCCP
ncbi:hypothetical protein MAPG_01257 [Magnaporthiopsis poae ATCC 64411]|uniref:Uncharacterized protein n=1 Tax=Magnaporthiopsis poae (strain ATCC 64411 / 73-15) TaxID=644358 RepID=A0A0C4DN78_MAGP6|nr:hypothetical protein MAPG_01257 [Magnaporthiopsis poae ATCC 64411]